MNKIEYKNGRIKLASEYNNGKWYPRAIVTISGAGVDELIDSKNKLTFQAQKEANDHALQMAKAWIDQK